ncbi:hypothetical protein [Sinorhizobium americanum]|uniref:hypothetical protein n=1 Tax=Sinorhizobium americanum TaxID=194963 RepID=UPI00104EF6DB|nr:hypothetical protein [Sinorhizobium americanum]
MHHPPGEIGRVKPTLGPDFSADESIRPVQRPMPSLRKQIPAKKKQSAWTTFRPRYITFGCLGTLINFQMAEAAHDLYGNRIGEPKMLQIPASAALKWPLHLF